MLIKFVIYNFIYFGAKKNVQYNLIILVRVIMMLEIYNNYDINIDGKNAIIVANFIYAIFGTFCMS